MQKPKVDGDRCKERGVLTGHWKEPSCSYGDRDHLCLLLSPSKQREGMGRCPRAGRSKDALGGPESPRAFSWCPALALVPLPLCQRGQARRCHPHLWHGSAGLPTWACSWQGCPYPADGSAAGHIPPRNETSTS